MKPRRVCPLCVARPVPVYRAICPDCFDMLPWKLRADLLNSYRVRVINPVLYQETLIEVRQWYENRLPSTGERGVF